ncbi:hypothetical protein JKF63_00709 [Porcisia hertigi]|uniref:C2 domain-containing protein n=1 Tax=Porcisia hertigi TaxID=2761500 RepID=A0A836HDK8_9TRYP|nr:hypothetical protein JKF63_00709 [Porcisia hertigi]
MGKLIITVHKCKLYRPVSSGNFVVNPRVTVVVDGTYRFQTSIKKNTVSPEFNDSFCVGNTHRLAVIEVSVYDVQEPSGLVLPGIGVLTAKRGVMRALSSIGTDEGEVTGATTSSSAGGDGAMSSNGGASSSSRARQPVLLGRCYISIERLVHHERKRRKYYLATPLPSAFAAASPGGNVFSAATHIDASEDALSTSPSAMTADVGPSLLHRNTPPGIAGTLIVSLESDSLGEPPSQLRLNEELEEAYVQRLRRFLICYDQPKVAVLDVLMAHVRDSTERGPHSSSGHRNNGNSSSRAELSARRGSFSQASKQNRSSANLSVCSVSTLQSSGFENVTSRGGIASEHQGSTRGREVLPATTSSNACPNVILPLHQDGSSTSGSISVPLLGTTLLKRTVRLGGRAELTVELPEGAETFKEMMERLSSEYHASEPGDFRVVLRANGCTNIDKDHWNESLLGSDDVFVIFRSEAEEFETDAAKLQNTVIWAQSNIITMDVVNPHRFYVTVILMGRCGTKTYEIGRCCVSAASLSQGHVSRRDMFLCMGESVTQVSVNGVVHLLMRPINFGLAPCDMAESVDGFYDRLSRFFKRYDPLRLPLVDALARSRLHGLDAYMKELVDLYGREPGTARLLVTIDSLISLRETAELDLSGQEVRVLLTMGSSSVRTKSFPVWQFAPTNVRENYLFDVVRETDLIRIEVVNAREDQIVYGRVDFSCLNTQRGTTNKRDLYLIGEAGTREAYFSGIVRVSLYSDEVGHNYEVDANLEEAFAGRLRRYVYRRIPENLHRVSLAVATVFDMESFIAQLAVQYGDEDPTYALFFTLVGCRQLRSRFGGINPYVVVRMGIDAYQTKTAKATEEPDYFEFFQFFYDRPEDMFITLVVMDQAGIGRDKEVGRAVIPLANVQPSRDYSDWMPVLNKRKDGEVRKVGTIGFKYTVVDLNLVDHTRARLMKEQYQKRNARAHVVMSGQGESEGVGTASLGAGDVDVPNPSSTVARSWGTFKRNLRQVSLSAQSMLAVSGPNRGTEESDRYEQTMNENTNLVEAGMETGSLKSAHSTSPRAPTMNLMDGGIYSVEEFCASDFSPLNSAALSETDLDATPSLQMTYRAPTYGADTLTGVCSLPMDEGRRASADLTRMRLRVRLLSCRNLCKSGRSMPNPYVLLSTICESHQSRVQFSTTEPQYNETFQFIVEDPSIDYLSITVLTDTPYGLRKLGHCTLSMRNVQCGTMCTRWMSLVVDPFQPSAMECGAVYLSLGAVHFGINCPPSIEAENRLREQIREYLRHHARRQLHRLEWYVGEFSQLENILLGGWFHNTGNDAGGDDTGTRVANLEVTVLGISHLYSSGFLAEGSCVVKVKVGGQTRSKTKPIAGSRGNFPAPQYQDPLCFAVTEPTRTLVRLSVILNEKTSVGECYVSLADLHRGVAKQRTLMLVMDSRSSRAEAVGFIHISIFCTNYGSSAPEPTKEELALHSRLTRFYYYYLPTELAMVDVKFATMLNVTAYLNRMVEKYGPEPGDYHLRVTVDRCRSLVIKNNNTLLHVFCVVRIGLQEFRSSTVEGRSEFIFGENFDLTVGLPQYDKVELILMRYYPSKQVELGRTQVELRALKVGENTMELSLVRGAGTKAAGVCGVLRITCVPVDFGRDSQTHARTHSVFAYGFDETLAQTTYLSALSAAVAVSGVSQHNSLPGERGNSKEPSEREHGMQSSFISPTTASVTIVGFIGLTLRDAEIYIRVSGRDRVLLKTKPIPADQLAALEASTSTFTIEDIAANYEKEYTLKLGFRKLLGTETLCYADFCLMPCPAEMTVEKRLRLYNLSSQFLGICRLSITLPSVHLPSQKWRHLSPTVFEPLMDDIASLVATYMPKDLRLLDLIVCQAPDARRLHRALRLQLEPTVVATVYVAIHDVDLRATAIRNLCVVTASVGNFTSEVPRRQPGAHPVYPYGMTNANISNLDFPLLRVDISNTGPTDSLTLCVCDRASKAKSEEVGRATVSLKALLSPAVFDMSEKVQVPLVSVRRAANRVNASLVGTITFSLIPPAFESYATSVRFASTILDGFDRDYFRYYSDRICRLLSHYDANSLVDIHSRLYETYVSCRCWESGLPAYLSSLVVRWGPELDSFGPPPALKSHDAAHQSRTVVSVVEESNAAVSAEQAPALALRSGK